MAAKNKHLKALLMVSVIVVVAGIALITAGFFVPPKGVIDSSVLVAYGESLTFAGALLGIDYSYRYKV